MTDNEVKWLIVGKLLRRNLMAGAVNNNEWETVFEGTVETAFAGYEGAYGSFDMPSNVYFSYDKLYTFKVTVDGETVIAENVKFTHGFGNAFLSNMLENDLTVYEDNGGNFYFHITSLFGYYYDSEGCLYTREAGTHTVKLERKKAEE